MGEKGTEKRPFYQKQLQADGFVTPRFMVTVDEGWRESILCENMYEWAADWLIIEIQGLPFAPGAH